MHPRILLSIGFLCAATGVKAQAVVELTGAPFSGTWTITTETAGSVTTTRTVAARASDGSVYTAYYEDGSPNIIQIYDVPHEKRIEIRPRTMQYTVQDAPNGRWITRTVEQQHAVLECGNIAFRREAPGQSKDSTSLGSKVIDGMTIYGHHFVRTRDDVRTMEGDTWTSDLGFNYSEHDEFFDTKKVRTTTLTEMKRGEPDASLFTVPSGYTQAPK
jgi:hypothetical protein